MSIAGMHMVLDIFSLTFFFCRSFLFLKIVEYWQKSGNEDKLKNRDDIKNENFLEREDDLKYGDNLKNEDDLKNKDYVEKAVCKKDNWHIAWIRTPYWQYSTCQDTD